MHEQYDAKQVFGEHLLRDERVLWAGQPDPSVNFTMWDIFLVPFSLIWGGFAVFWEVSVLVSMIPRNGMGVMFALFGIPFVLVGLYLIFGRFIYKRWRKHRTYYAVTNRRVLSLTKVGGQQFQSKSIASIAEIGKRVGRSGTGTLTFGGRWSMFLWGSWGTGSWANTGMDIFPFFGSLLMFSDIKNVNEVHKLIMDLESVAA